jgi:Ca2+-binding RTX toxin-like protein
VNFGSTGNTFLDTQLERVALASGPIRSSFSTDALGGNNYTFDNNFENNFIDEVYVHNSDNIDASNVNRDLNFIFVEPVDFSTVAIVGTSRDDTLTLNIATAPSTVTIDDVDFALQGDVEFLVLNSVDPLGRRHAEFIVELGATAQAAGISSVVGGNGGDSLDASSMTQAVTLSGGLNVRLELDDTTSLTILQDTLIGGTVADSLYGDNFYDLLEGNDGADTLNGTSDSALGANEIDTLTGGLGADVFILGDASNAYYNTASGRGDYAIITDFSAGDIIQLKNVSSLYPFNGSPAPVASPTYNFGYVEGGGLAANIFNVPVSYAGMPLVTLDRFIYADADGNGIISSGDNLIAAVDSGVGALDLTDTTIFNFV